MFIANYTPDDIPWMHIGVPGVLKAGDFEEFEDKRGNHILTKFGARGLIRLRFGDNVEDAKKKSMEQYRKFWEYQIEVFNQDNELRRNEHRAYVRPTKMLEEHAQRLDIQLIAPWTMKQNQESTNAEVKAENEELKMSVAALMKQVEKLTEIVSQNQEVPFKMLPPQQQLEAVDKALKEGKTQPKKETAPKEKARLDAEEGEFGHVDEDLEVYTNQFKGFDKSKLAEYIFSNSNDINGWPDEAKLALREYWGSIFGKNAEFPLPA